MLMLLLLLLFIPVTSANLIGESFYVTVDDNSLGLTTVSVDFDSRKTQTVQNALQCGEAHSANVPNSSRDKMYL